MSHKTASSAALRVSYTTLDPREPLADDVLAVVAFGDGAPCPDDSRCVRIALQPLDDSGRVEIWRGRGKARLGTSGPIRFVADGHCMFGWINLDESRLGGLAEATEIAYRGLLAFQAASEYRHVWRMWNFVTAINEGTGDDERYKLFSLGRARAFAAAHVQAGSFGYPAATAVGKPGGPRALQICWMAGREPGMMIENPRQVAAYHYPRSYGPAAPSFSRATLLDTGILLISGTASIVGHASAHEGDVLAQVDETLKNLDSLLQRARAAGRLPSASLGPSSLLKVYVRPGVETAPLQERLRERFGNVPTLMVAAEICRKELLIEIEVVQFNQEEDGQRMGRDGRDSA